MLLLDELTRGLDVEERERVSALARQPVPGRLILYSTHEPADAERLADRVIVLQQGQVIFSGEADALRRKAQGAVHRVTVPASCYTSHAERGTRNNRVFYAPHIT